MSARRRRALPRGCSTPPGCTPSAFLQKQVAAVSACTSSALAGCEVSEHFVSLDFPQTSYPGQSTHSTLICDGKKLDLQPGQDVINFYLPFVPLAALTVGTTRGISGKIYCPFPSKHGQAVLHTRTCKSRGNGVQRG